MDHPIFHWALEEARNLKGRGPDGRRGPLGWTIAGPTCGHTSVQHHGLFRIRQETENQIHIRSGFILQNITVSSFMVSGKLKDLVEKQWEMEEPPTRDLPLTRKEKLAMTRLEESRIFKDGMYTVGVPWNPDMPKPKYNKPLAEKRLIALEKSDVCKGPEEWQRYYQTFLDWELKGYARRLGHEEKLTRDGYYLPHFPVFREEADGSRKIRPVLDSAAKFRGNCMNDSVLPGPKLMLDLPTVLLHFRANSISLTGDVSEMYLRIGLAEEDRKYHRVITLDESEQQIELEFTRHVFGNPGSPVVAMSTVEVHAEKYAKKFPRAVKVIKHARIMDDHMDSFETPEEAAQVAKQLIEIYAECGMRVRKWASSSPEVLGQIPEADHAKSIEILEVTPGVTFLPTVKTLGVKYVAKEDSFTFAEFKMKTEIWTKRSILQNYMKVFDPLGFIVPFIFKARLIFQQLWLRGCEWDETAPPLIVREWEKWLEQLGNLPKFTMSRCLQLVGKEREVDVQQIHIFCDASKKGYGCVAYLQTRYKNGQKNSAFKLARARLAPVSYKSIPRLELMATVLALSVWTTTLRVYPKLRESTKFYTDSQIVLAWIHAYSRCLTIFVGNRISRIHEETTVEQWHFVETHRNPVDIASRGASIVELSSSKLWKQGPDFLYEHTAKNPRNPHYAVTKEVLAEVRKGHEYGTVSTLFLTNAGNNLKKDGVSEVSEFILHPAQKSSWIKLKRITAWCLRWRYKNSRRSPTLTGQELARAALVMIRTSQKEGWSKTLAEIEHDGRVRLQNQLATVRPELDDSGTLRVFARLSSATHLPFATRCPAILHKDHPLVGVILFDLHTRVLKHIGGSGTLVSEYNKKFYTPSILTLAKSITGGCVICKRVTAKPRHQIMAPLPDDRFMPSPNCLSVFSWTGMDVAGPFYPKRGRGTVKRYLLLFCCAQFRAVHLEMLNDLSTDAFMCAFSRFVLRRPRPRMVRSDNATNFKRGQLEISELIALINHEAIANKYPEIKWVFNPPGAPHTGGFFERMIGLAKAAMAHLLPPGDFSEDEMNTVFVETECMLNSRPLTTIPNNDPADPEILTPAHFLSGTGLQGICQPPSGQQFPMLRRWYVIQSTLDTLWARFVKEIIPQMHAAEKWNQERVEVKIGDLVVLFEDRVRNHWPLARVSGVTSTLRDGRVRTVEVLYKGKHFTRSVHDILRLDALMEAAEDGPEVEELGF